MTDSRRFYLATASVLIALVVGLGGLFLSFSQDRQSIAVAIESLAIASTHQSEVNRGLQRSITEIEASLRLLAQQNASVLVLQSQIVELNRRIEKLEGQQR